MAGRAARLQPDIPVHRTQWRCEPDEDSASGGPCAGRQGRDGARLRCAVSAGPPAVEGTGETTRAERRGVLMVMPDTEMQDPKGDLHPFGIPPAPAGAP